MAQILVVEDEQIIAKNVADALRYAGHEVEIADCGEIALKRFDEINPDLVVLAVRLPHIRGRGVLWALRSPRRRPQARIVTSAGRFGNADITWYQRAVNAFTKVFDQLL